MPAVGSSRKEKRCRVLGCGKLLLMGGPCATYCRKRRICHTHLQAAVIEEAGQCYRFCHQCGRLHPLRDFDGTRRSCTASLSKRRDKEAQAHGREQAAAQPTPTHSEEAAAGDGPCMATDKDQEQEQHWQLLPAGSPALAGPASAGEAAAVSTDASTAGLPQHCCRSSAGDVQVAATPLMAPPPTADHGGCSGDDDMADRLLQELLRDVQWGPDAEAFFAGGSNGRMHGTARLPLASSRENQELEQLAMLLEQELLAAAVAAPAAAGRSDDDADTWHNNSNSGRSCCCLAGLAGPAAPAAAAPARHLPAPGSFSSGVGGQDAECGPAAQQIAWRQRHQELLWQHQQLSALLQQVSAAASMLQLLL